MYAHFKCHRIELYARQQTPAKRQKCGWSKYIFVAMQCVQCTVWFVSWVSAGVCSDNVGGSAARSLAITRNQQQRHRGRREREQKTRANINRQRMELLHMCAPYYFCLSVSRDSQNRKEWNLYIYYVCVLLCKRGDKYNLIGVSFSQCCVQWQCLGFVYLFVPSFSHD